MECRQSLEVEKERYLSLELTLASTLEQLSQISEIAETSGKSSEILKESLSLQTFENSRLSEVVSTSVAREKEDASVISGLREELKIRVTFSYISEEISCDCAHV